MAALAIGIAQTAVGATPPSADQVSKIDGTSLSGQIVGIDAEGGVRLADSTIPLRLDELSVIERPAAKPAPAGEQATCVVELLGGGRLLGQEVTIRNQKCHLRSAEAEPLVIPVEMIAAIRLQPQAKDRGMEAALAQANREVDRIFVQANGVVQAIDGLVESLDAQEIAFEWQGKIRKVPRQSLQVIVLAVVGKPSQFDKNVQVTFQSGALVGGRIVTLADSKLTMEIAPKVQAIFHWLKVSKVVVRSSRLAYLSDLDPVEALDEPIATFAMPWQRNKSVSGKPLTMAGRTYDRGLGVHARNRLRYELGGRFDEFSATIGLDAAAAGRGDCIFIVQADGREIHRQRVRGPEPPRDIKLDVRGAQQLTLIVDPGEDLDLADHADWANARLLRVRSQP